MISIFSTFSPLLTHIIICHSNYKYFIKIFNINCNFVLMVDKIKKHMETFKKSGTALSGFEPLVLAPKANVLTATLQG